MMISIFNIKPQLVSLLLVLLPAIVLANTAVSIQLYSVSTQPFVSIPTGLKPCYLDVTRRQLQSINHDLAEQSVGDTQTFVQQHAQQFKHIAHSRVCQFQAAQLGVTTLPAIVFNSETVIYGVRDVNAAINCYQQRVRGQS